ncbi:YggS family pyridoxal phosphate-dependent enzyme [Lactococcus termiticola]|nr:YggS family pyridoxal phosphate-dependent enzyme [Lactococcus termiticola]
MQIKENVKSIRERVDKAVASSPFPLSEPHVIGVTKYVDAETARQLVEAGIHDIAENRTELFLEKQEALSDLDGISWHLIGSLQRRKVKEVINKVDYFHALDSLKLAQEIEKRAEHEINCFVQVNVSGEASKHGFSPEELEEALTSINALSRVKVVGLMTMAPIDATESELADIFGKTYQLKEKMRALKLPNIPCTELSMGMSRDFETAISNGASFVRIGTEFFK